MYSEHYGKVLNLGEQKYAVGEIVEVHGWTKTTRCRVDDIHETYHNRMGEYVWGYAVTPVDGNRETGFAMTYIPQGYLRKITAEVT